jgi:hypothetical protein
MAPIEALIDLLGRVGACGGTPALVTDEELHQWHPAAVKALKAQGLISKTRPASSAICSGCERECVMPVYFQAEKSTALKSFIVCDKRSDINRVPIPLDRLTQWRCGIEEVCGFVASSLGIRHRSKHNAEAGLWEIGLAAGKKRTHMLCLKADGELVLVAGTASAPLVDLVLFNDGNFQIDRSIVHSLVDSSATTDPRYTPSEARREARKLDTKAMHDRWRKAYRDLKKERQGRSDSWIAKKIAKMDIANGRSAETIRKNMKK